MYLKNNNNKLLETISNIELFFNIVDTFIKHLS